MNTNFHKRSTRRIIGLLLALPCGGLALSPSAATAQTAPTLSPGTSTLSPQQASVVQGLLRLAANDRACATMQDIKVQNASLQDVIAQVKKSLPANTPIEVRDASPVQVSFALMNARIGNVLSSMASLAGCKLFVLPSGIVIAPPTSLTDQEKRDIVARKGGEWSKSTTSGGSGWSAEIAAQPTFAQAIVDDIRSQRQTPDGATQINNISFGALSLESQMMLAQLINWVQEESLPNMLGATPMEITHDTSIALDWSDPKMIGIRIKPNDPADGGIGLNIVRPN